VLAAVSVVLICGCDRQARHRWLTFFFTGVPPLEASRASGTDGKKEDSNRPGTQPAGGAVPAVVLYAHPLYAARRCEACHATSAALGPQASSGRGSSRILGGTSAASPARLRMPVRKLCAGCHEDKSEAAASARGLWLHTPAAKGKCLACHAPHQSRYPHVLTKPPERQCAVCHMKDVVANPASHKAVKRMSNNCLQCHNPHAGRDRKMLTADYREALRPVGTTPAAVRQGLRRQSGSQGKDVCYPLESPGDPSDKGWGNMVED